jgi:hypothetical protein
MLTQATRPQERPLQAETITICPICSRETLKEGKNGFALCPVHSWIKGVKTIDIKGRA